MASLTDVAERVIQCPCGRGGRAAEITYTDGSVEIIGCDDCQDENDAEISVAVETDRRLDYRYCPACGAWRYFEIIRAGRAGAVCDGCTARADRLAATNRVVK